MPKKPIKLARPGDPYVMSDGRIVAPVFCEEAVQSTALTVADFKPTKQRSAKDLPAPQSMMKAIATVLVYSLLGLGHREIAEALGIDVGIVDKVKAHPGYDETFQALFTEMINVNSEHMMARIAAYGPNALKGLANIAFHGKAETNQLRAQQDLLDRGGHSKKQASGAMNGANDLRIIVEQGDSTVEVNIGGL